MTFSNFVTSRPDLYEKLEKRPFHALCDWPGKLFFRHSDLMSEMAGLLCRVIVARVEDHVLPQLSLSKDLWSCVPILPSIPRKPSQRRVEPDLD
jgi:hypothetical protein